MCSNTLYLCVRAHEMREINEQGIVFQEDLIFINNRKKLSFCIENKSSGNIIANFKWFFTEIQSVSI